MSRLPVHSTKTLLTLAPMADVTHVAFRRIVARYGKADIMWTEFVNVSGLSNVDGRKALLVDLLRSQEEKPVIAQLFG